MKNAEKLAQQISKFPLPAVMAALLTLPGLGLAQNRSVVVLPTMDRTAQSHALGDGGWSAPS